MLLAGFPCQPFSQAGLQKGFEDTRGTLFFYIAEIIQHHQPNVILLENVKRLKTHDKGKTFQVMKSTLESLGYVVFSRVLAAKDFGIPQNRERIYIVALKNRAMASGIALLTLLQNTPIQFRCVITKMVLRY